MAIAIAAGYMLAGIACVFMGLTFINGQLLPQVLGGVYAAIPSAFARTMIMNVSIIIGANMLIARGYMVGGQAVGGSLYVLSVVIGMTITAMLVDKVSLNVHVIGGMLVLCGGALWVVHGLSQTTPA